MTTSEPHLPLNLRGKVAVVTGGGRGLGRRYALELAAAGADVVVNDLGVSVDGERASTGPATEVAQEIQTLGGNAVANHADVSDPEGAASICRDALTAFGGVHILVNNAGIVRDAPFADMAYQEFDRVVRVHLHGTFLVSQPIFTHMAANGGGVIINTTSRSGIRGKTQQANYGAAKAGIIGLSTVMALEGAPHGIRVWTISPRFASRAWEGGGVVTSSGPITEELRDRYNSDAAAAVLLYMLSDRAQEHTGKVVFASADCVQEIRWHAANGIEIDNFDGATERIANATDEGTVLFAEPSNLGTPI